MGIISWILLGLIAGSIAKFLTPGRDPGGIILTIVLGIVGGVVGGFIGSALGFGSVDAFDLRGLFLAVGGSVLLLVLYRLLRRPAP